MRNAIAFVLFVISVAAGLYFGIWWAFIGGIVDVIDAVKADVTNSLDVAVGVFKVMFAGVIGWGTVAFGSFIAFAFAEK